MTAEVELKLYQSKQSGQYAAECPFKCGWGTAATLKKEVLSRMLAHMNVEHRESNKVGNA
jgi:hypothetical protein